LLGFSLYFRTQVVVNIILVFFLTLGHSCLFLEFLSLGGTPNLWLSILDVVFDLV